MCRPFFMLMLLHRISYFKKALVMFITYLHLALIVPVLLLGPFILFRPKGDKLHKVLGRVWVICMLISCLLSFGITHDGGLSWLHGLAAFTIYSIIRGVLYIRAGNIKAHRSSMIGPYIGTVIAFIYALSPERFLGSFFSHIFS